MITLTLPVHCRDALMQSVIRQFKLKAREERSKKHDAKHGPEPTKKLLEHDWKLAIDELNAARDLFQHIESQFLETELKEKKDV